MNVSAKRAGPAFLLDLDGPLTVETDTRHLHERVRTILESNASCVVFDLAQVDDLDCSGIGQLVRLQNQIRRSGGAVVLINVKDRVKRLLRLAGLLAVFPVFETWQDAMSWREHSDSRGCDIAWRPPVAQQIQWPSDCRPIFNTRRPPSPRLQEQGQGAEAR